MNLFYHIDMNIMRAKSHFGPNYPKTSILEHLTLGQRSPWTTVLLTKCIKNTWGAGNSKKNILAPHTYKMN